MTTDSAVRGPEVPDAHRRGRVKCVVWDLDNTLWNGVLLEGDACDVRPEVVEVIRHLDSVGILHSIASKNDRAAAWQRLTELGLTDLFLHPEIGWQPKSESIQRIAASLNIGLDAIAFVDDQPFELAEVAYAVPEVLRVDVVDLADAIRWPEFEPRFVTEESRNRREMYRTQSVRAEAEREFAGTNEDFLRSLDMVFTIVHAEREHLQRAEELTLRTNQLNSTGRTYSYDELDAIRVRDDHLLLVASLTDTFGSYGTIGLALVEKGDLHWDLRLLLMSCRVVSRGVGMVLLNHVTRLARDDGATLRADFVETGRNRMMQVTYAFAGFREIARDGDRVVLERDADLELPEASYVRLVTDPIRTATP
ncbi:HAD-IIIC family phosphatase [Plantactinospora sp. S1510]|uniref:HAD-IIIC family phosphatase n=1 Tax=Plantactinospora alkalitolerans TaxID=2789879 RepID=A0ABS0H2Y0_9ACTN|nr:HAD-IIIC family phosphatase [Plantactinospora alkalitolerans]MBF9132816.1 HAD-IIIC family phosphatase [Plantactinospora alkalitolerans]